MRENMARTRSVKNTDEMRFEYWNLDDIHPSDDNPRDNDHAVEFVMNSIQTYGFIVPIVISSDGEIAAGHTRYKAAKLLNKTKVPVLVADHLTPQQLQEFRIMDNKLAEHSRWDFDLLAPQIANLTALGVDFTRYGWSQEEIDCLSDVVQEDCLSAGSVVSMESQQHRGRESQRAPSMTRMVIGEFVFFIPQEVYRRWASEMRAIHDYSEQDIISELKNRLGITGYEDDHQS